MYCKKCGKFIGNDSDYCDECSAKETEVFEEFAGSKVETATPVQEYAPAPTYYGSTPIKLGKSIAAMVLSEVGFWFVYMAIMMASAMVTLYDYSWAIWGVIGLATTILGFIFGIQSIKNFKKTSHIRSGKRIPVLILGICSVVMAGIGLFLALLLVCVIALLLV